MRLLPPWLSGYQRAWLLPDLVAGLIVWSVVTPQAVAYAQIAGLPPSAGLAAAPGALLAYALLGTSRSLVVSATTATSALSAVAVGPLADGDAARFAALSAALALVTAAVLVAAGFLRLGGVMDIVSKPVMTGFLFGLGLTVAVGQLSKIFGIEGGSGHFFGLLRDLVQDLDHTSGLTLLVGAASIAGLIAFAKLAPALPGTLIVLAASIAVSALFDLQAHGVDVVGEIPSAVPDPSIPDVGWRDLVDLIPAALGVMIVSAEAIGVSRTIARADGYSVDVNRDLVAIGGSNALAGLSRRLRPVRRRQPDDGRGTLRREDAAAVDRRRGARPAHGSFSGAALRGSPPGDARGDRDRRIAGFFRVNELRRFARLRRSAIVLSLVALVGVLLFGVLPGLLLAAGLSLIVLVQRLSRPPGAVLARDPATGAWGSAERHPEWTTVPESWSPARTGRSSTRTWRA